MDFEKVLGVLLNEFKKENIDFALVGGLALQFAVKDDRMTRDIDLVVLLKDSDKVDKIMKGIGYESLLRTENVANYSGLSEMGQVDFIFAHRKHALRMLERAESKELHGFKLKVAKPEDLIGLKIQSSSNNPSRLYGDLHDIQEIMRANRKSMDWELVREYYRLFNRENELEEAVKRLNETD